MKILIVVDGPYPSYSAASKRISNYVKSLILEDNSPSILPIFFNIKSGFLKLIFAPIVPLLAFFKVLKEAHNTSAVLIYGFGWISSLLIICSSKIRNNAVVMELNEKPYTIQGSKRDIILKYINPFHKFCLSALVYPLINGFIVISDPLAEFINKFKSDTSIICKIPILVDFNFYQEDVKMPACKIPYIIHTAIPNDNKDGIINVFLAFSKIVSELGIDLHFYLTSKIGMTKVRGIIYEIINRHNLNQRVTFLGDLEEESLIEYQKYCCMVVINKVFSEQNKYNFATKIGEYLALGKPIITTKYGEVTTYLKDNISCLYVDPTDVDDIAKAMTRIITDSKLRKTLESQGKLIAQNIFDYHSQSKLINTFFKEVSKKY